MRLPGKANEARVRYRPPREDRLPMVCGRRFGSLDKFLKLAPEHVIHLQLPSNLFGDVQVMSAARIEIHFLQDENVCLCAREEIYDCLKL